MKIININEKIKRIIVSFWIIIMIIIYLAAGSLLFFKLIVDEITVIFIKETLKIPGYIGKAFFGLFASIYLGVFISLPFGIMQFFLEKYDHDKTISNVVCIIFALYLFLIFPVEFLYFGYKLASFADMMF
jgi:ABC-type phosphate transport system permease subunit